MDFLEKRTFLKDVGEEAHKHKPMQSIKFIPDMCNSQQSPAREGYLPFVGTQLGRRSMMPSPEHTTRLLDLLGFSFHAIVFTSSRVPVRAYWPSLPRTGTLLMPSSPGTRKPLASKLLCSCFDFGCSGQVVLLTWQMQAHEACLVPPRSTTSVATS